MNLLIVFALSGLWHGAEWSFVIWGLLNGLYQVMEDVFMRFGKQSNKKISLYKRIFKTIGTFLLIDFAWIFFRSSTITQAVSMVKSVIFNFRPEILFDGSLYSCGLEKMEFCVMLISLAILLVADIISYREIRVSDAIEAQPLWVRWPVYILSIIAIVVFGVWGSQYDAASFIYFQF